MSPKVDGMQVVGVKTSSRDSRYSRTVGRKAVGSQGIKHQSSGNCGTAAKWLD